MKVYITGSLRNPDIPKVGEVIRSAGFNVFDDWFAAGEKADDEWARYEKLRGHSLTQALEGFAANHVFGYDKHHLDTSDAIVLVTPAGRSSFLELGYMVGRGKPAYVLVPKDPERWDVMLLFANGVFESLADLIIRLQEDLLDRGQFDDQSIHERLHTDFLETLR